MTNQITCPDAVPNFLNFFDFAIAPPLLFYSYIPIIVVSLLLSFFILFRDRFSLNSKLLLLLSVFFAIWSSIQIVHWIAVYASTVHFSWQMIALVEVLILVFAVYFVAAFLNRRDIGFTHKLLLGLIVLPVIITLPTAFGAESFNLVDCESINGYIWDYIYLVEVISIVVIAEMCFRKFRSLPKGDPFRKQVAILGTGVFLFLGMFAATNILGDTTFVYEFNLWGPLGMVAFIALLAFMIVRYKTFDIKLFGAQALVFALVALIGSEFFFVETNTNRILVAATLVVTGFIGLNLIRSVKKEVEQRERIEKLAKELGVANEKLKGLDKLKSEFLSLASHQIRSPLTAIKGYASMLSEGAFGKMSEKQVGATNTIFQSAQGLVNVVEDFLNVSKIEQGGMKYEFAPTHLDTLVTDLVAEMKVSAENKHLDLSLSMKEGDTYTVMADSGKLKQVFLNLVDNAIKYTPSGFVQVALSRDKKKNKITFSVTDSGAGISPEAKEKLFQKFNRGDGMKLNTNGSGLGLYLAREIARAHKGDVAILSAGLGKGSTFSVELPSVA